MKNTIDALALKKAFIAGANNLDNKKDYINELNVFPVPDGDTGTNMSMTIWRKSLAPMGLPWRRYVPCLPPCIIHNSSTGTRLRNRPLSQKAV